MKRHCVILKPGVIGCNNFRDCLYFQIDFEYSGLKLVSKEDRQYTYERNMFRATHRSSSGAQKL
jgi:hypothetical protein